MSNDIADWTSAETFHPRMTITAAPIETVVAVVRQEFERVGYTTKEATSTRTRLLHRDWLAIASGVWARTEVVLTAGDDSVLVEVTRGPENRTGRKKGQQALNAAVTSLRKIGTEPVLSPWHKAP